MLKYQVLGCEYAGRYRLARQGGDIGGRDDQLGAVFSQDLKAIGVDYPMRAATEGPSTARCLVFVTPDADRTMQTYLGVSVMLVWRTSTRKRSAMPKSHLEGYLSTGTKRRRHS